MTSPFSSPSSIPSADYFKPSEHVGSLILFKPTGQDLAYTYGGVAKKPVETTIADVTVFNEEQVEKSLEFKDAHIGPYGIRKILVPAINEKLVLARLRQKPNPSLTESGAYYLDDPTESEVELAQAYLSSKAPQL